MLSGKSKYILLVLLAFTVFSCKNSDERKMDASEEVSQKENDWQTFKGDFVYGADAAVLQVGNSMYSVKINEKSEELARMVRPAKTTDFDMVLVTIKGTVAPKANDAEGWDNIITIKEIVSVSDTASPTDIKIKETKK